MKTALLFLLLSSSLLSQVQLTEHTLKTDSGYKHPSVSIHDFAGITGYWKGTGLGGNCEELWMPAADGIMHGSFRLVKDDKLVFSEYMSISRDSSGYVLKVKHFNPDHTGWEEKNKWVSFPFIKADASSLWFRGLTFIVKGEELSIYLAFKKKDGSYKEERFSFTRAKL